ncbi:hypothetical protein [Burkholderia sp. GbtcB21]|uniref:hypothetical protein n=1 Tax=Burkholderia sp. GbtcB21 TaxID=2824766 RepID=UPI001C2FAE0D|nr:hypothetical protein [Burkholderia sp. GbtcB21]
MSIPATFTFALQYGGSATYYTRSGGDPAGAAVYLLAAHRSDALTSLGDRFHRENEVVELTSPGVHKDLFYRYAIDLGGYLFAYRIDAHTDEWETVFSGHYAAFINGHAPLEALGDGTLKLIKTSTRGDRREWVTRGQLIKRHAAAVAALTSHRQRFPDSTDCIASYHSEVAELDLAQRYDEGGELRVSASVSLLHPPATGQLSRSSRRCIHVLLELTTNVDD